MTAARIPLSYWGLPHRSDSSAPHSARLMMLGGCPGIMTPDGGVHCVLAGACGGEMRIAEMFCPKGCSLDAGLYPKPSFSGGSLGGGGWVIGASSGRVTAICTVVVAPTKTGSVLRAPSVGPAAWADPATPAPLAGLRSGAPVSYSVWYQGPHDPSGRFARTRVEVPARSPVSATNENGLSCVTSRTVTPPPSPISDCSVSWVSRTGGASWTLRPCVASATADTMTTVAAMAVSNIVGGRLRDDTSRCYSCF